MAWVDSAAPPRVRAAGTGQASTASVTTCGWAGGAGRAPCSHCSPTRGGPPRGRDLVRGEGPGAAEEPQALRRLQAEPGAAARDHVEHQLGVLPHLELGTRDPHRHAVDAVGQRVRALSGTEPEIEEPDQYVTITDDGFPCGVTHRRRAVAASAGLVHHQWAVCIA